MRATDDPGRRPSSRSPPGPCGSTATAHGDTAVGPRPPPPPRCRPRESPESVRADSASPPPAPAPARRPGSGPDTAPHSPARRPGGRGRDSAARPVPAGAPPAASRGPRRRPCRREGSRARPAASRWRGSAGTRVRRTVDQAPLPSRTAQRTALIPRSTPSVIWRSAGSHSRPPGSMSTEASSVSSDRCNRSSSSRTR